MKGDFINGINMFIKTDTLGSPTLFDCSFQIDQNTSEKQYF